jgi:Rieske Fe-S protein
MTGDAVSRRAALGAAGVVVAGGVAGYVAGRNTDAAKATPASGGSGGGAYGGGGTPSSAASGPSGPSGGKKLTTVAAIPDGGGVIVDNVVVVRSGQEVHAFSAICTHQGCEVNKVSDGKIKCPCHFSVFDASTGAVVSGPAPSPLPKVAVTVSNGEVLRG